MTHKYNDKFTLVNVENAIPDIGVYFCICEELVNLFFQRDIFYSYFRWEIDCTINRAFTVDSCGRRTMYFDF